MWTILVLKILTKTLDKYSKNYDKFFPCWWFQRWRITNTKSIIKESTGSKMYRIQLYWSLCNKWSLSFQSTIATSNGLSDFHKIVITVMTMSFKEHSPTERHYRDYKYFDQTKCENKLKEKFSEVKLTINQLKLLSLKCLTNMLN